MTYQTIEVLGKSARLQWNSTPSFKLHLEYLMTNKNAYQISLKETMEYKTVHAE